MGLVAATLNTQYMPLTQSEASDDDAVSVRVIRDLAESINNFKAHFGTTLINCSWPVTSAGFSATNTDTDSTSEKVICHFAARVIGKSYNIINVSACGKMRNDPGSEEVYYKLYCTPYLPKHVVGTVAAGQLDRATSVTLTFDDDVNYAWKHGQLSIPTSIDAGPAERVYFLLTGQNSTSDASFNGYLTNLSATVAYE